MDYKTKALFIVSVGLAVSLFFNFQKPRIEKQTITDTKEVEKWKAQYNSLQEKYTRDISRNVKTTCLTHIVYNSSGVKVSEDISSETLDLSKIDSSNTSSSTTTITTEGKTIEKTKEVVKYKRTSIFLGGFESGLLSDYGIRTGMSVDDYNFDVSYGIIRKELIVGATITIITW